MEPEVEASAESKDVSGSEAVAGSESKAVAGSESKAVSGSVAADAVGKPFKIPTELPSELISGSLNEIYKFVKTNLLIENKEYCGILTKVSNNFKLILNGIGDEIDASGDGVCSHASYSNIIWHTHPDSVKRYYPSIEDVVKILKHSEITESYIFCKYGLWKMTYTGEQTSDIIGNIDAIKTSQAQANLYKSTSGYIINYYNFKLDKVVSPGNIYDSTAITTYCDNLSQKIIGLKMTFTDLEGNVLGSKKKRSKKKRSKRSKKKRSKKKRSKKKRSKKKR